MRQRRLKDLDERMDRLKGWFIEEPETLKGKWADYFKEQNGGEGRKIYLEIGCGKGKFITDHARKNPENNYIALEGQESVIVRAMDKAEDQQLNNIAFLSLYMVDICDYFEENEIDGIYLNFSDPWPKARHAKRRLTFRGFLEKYRKIIKPNGFIEVKTDNDGLYDFTLEEIEALGYKIVEASRDLHNSEYKEGNITTEYEEKFAGKGKNINYVKVEFGGNMLLAQKNGRVIPKEDKIFALNSKAKELIAKEGKDAVINATIGALLADDGELAVMQSVMEAMKDLKDSDYAEYAPIGGTPDYKRVIAKAAFYNYEPKSFVETVAVPGGTGGISNVISNYSQPGDKVITSDWFWSPYKSICAQQGRELVTFELFNENNGLNMDAFAKTVYDVAEEQGRVVILLNTPAHNPTGYSVTEAEWDKIVEILNDERLSNVPVALFVDVAYIDFAGDPAEVRTFLPKLDEMKENVLPIIGYSASKTFTFYGMRTGAIICMAKTEEIAKEFKTLSEYAARNVWSNCNRSGQQAIVNIYKDDERLKKVDEERKEFRDMLLERGRVFEEAAKKEGLDVVPFDAGFFACIACENSEAVSEKLTEKGVFAVPLAKGIRVSVASINKEQCVKAAKIIAEVLK